jgi:hypothetical protein
MTRPAATAERADGAVIAWPLELDTFLVAIVAASLVAMVAALVAVWIEPASAGERLAILAFYLGMAALFAVLVVPTRYELDLDELRVRAGLTRYRARWDELARVEVGWSLLSSTTAAWTMRRVRLVTRGGRVLEVGPRDRLGFVAEVLARSPQLVADPSSGRRRAWHDPAHDRRRRRA